MKIKKKLGIGFAFVFFIIPIFIVGSVISFLRYSRVVERVLPGIIADASNNGVHLKVQRLFGTLITGIEADSLNIYIPRANLTVTSESLEAGFSIFDLIKGDLVFSDVEIKNVSVIITESEKTNTDSIEISQKSEGYPDLPKMVFEHILVSGIHLDLPGNLIINGDYLEGTMASDSLFTQMDVILTGAEVVDIFPKIESLEFKVEGDTGHYQISRLNIVQPNGEINLVGYIDILPAVPAQVSLGIEADIDDLSEWFRSDQRSFWLHEADMSISGRLDGNYKGFYAAVNVTYKNSENIQLQEGHLEVDYANQEWFFNRVIMQTNVGKLEGTANFAPPDKLYLLAGLNDITLDSTIVPGSLAIEEGWINVIMENIDPERMTGFGSVVLDQINIAKFRADNFSLLFEAKDGMVNFLESSKIIISDESTIQLQGTLAYGRDIDFTAFAFNNQFADYTRALSGVSVNGHFTGYLNIQGPIFNPSIYGDLQVDSLIHPFFSLGPTTLNANINSITYNREGSVRFTAYGGTILNQPVKKAEIRANISDLFIEIEQAQISSRESEVSLTGFADLRRQTATIEKVNGQWEQYSVVNEKEIIINWEENSLFLQPFLLSDNLGAKMLVENFSYPQGEENSNIKIREINLSALTKIVNSPVKLTGVATAEITGKKILDGGSYSAFIKGDSVTFAGTDMGHIELEIIYDDSALAIRKFSAFGGKMALESNGKWDFSNDANLDIDWDHFNLRMLGQIDEEIPYLEGLSDGRISLSGSLENPTIKVMTHLKDIKTEHLAANKITAGLTYNDGLLKSDSLYVVYDLDTVYLEIQWPMRINLKDFSKIKVDSNFAVTSHGVLQGKTLKTPFLNQFESVKGNIEWEIDAIRQDRGIYFNSGYLKINDATVDVTELSNQIHDVNGDVFFHGYNISIHRIEGHTEQKYSGLNKWLQGIRNLFGIDDNTGDIHLNGKISLQDLSKPKLDLNVTASNLYLNYFPIHFETVVDIDSLIINIHDNVNVSGGIVFQYAEFNISPLLMDKLQYLYGSTGTGNGGTSNDIVLNLSMPGNFNVHSQGFNLVNSFNLELSGDLTVHSGKTMGVVGKLIVEEGNVYYIKSFDIQNGELFFISPNKLDTQVDIIAERVEKGKYLFQFVIQGEIDKLNHQMVVRDISTNQIIPMSDKDKLALLTIGAEGGQFAADSLGVSGNAVLLEASGVALEGLARQWNIADRIDFKANVFNPGGGNHNYFVYGKYLTSKLYVEYQGRLSELDVSGAAVPMPNFSWQAGNQVGIKYRINKSWSLNTTMLRTFENNNKYRFDLRWKKEF